MLAVRDAAPAAGKFPVVIYAPSFSASAAENADLCEFLASHGYLVIASPSLGPQARGMTDDLEGLEAQAADIRFLIGYAHTLPQADVGRIAVAGFSWGGLSNLFAAAKDPRIKALVSLDGSVRYFPKLIADSKYVTPARVTAPLLLLAARPVPIEDTEPPSVDASTSFLNKMKYADVYRVTLYPMQHGHFASNNVLLAGDERFEDYTREEVTTAYGWAGRYVRSFLDAHLKGDVAALAFLNAAEKDTGAPPHLLRLSTRRSAGAPPTRATFAAELGRRGFDAAPAVYEAMRKAEPDFAIPESELNSWGYQLLTRKETAKAIAILKLAVSLHPESANTYDSLGEVYEIAGNKPLAIRNYQRSLELNPGNDNARAHLKTLGAPAK
jgi:dienelactone hydrolase